MKKLILAGIMLVTLIPTVVLVLKSKKVACSKKPQFIEL